MSVPCAGRVLGVDLGERRIGVASSDSDQRLALPADTVVRSGDRPAEHRALRSRVEEYEAVGVVVGLPRGLSGALGPAARSALAEVDELRVSLGVPVETVDERLTTVTASAALRRGGRPARSQRAVIDAAAASELLQTWLDRRRAADARG